MNAVLRTTVLTALAPIAWGTTFLVTTELLPPDRPLTASLLRALPAGLLALLIAQCLPHGHWWWRSLVLGTLNIGAFFPLLFLAAERLPGGAAATLGAVQPLLVTLLVVVVLSERLCRWRLLWGGLGVVGVGMVVLGPAAALDGLGVVAGLAGAVCMAFGVVLTKRWGRPDGVGPVGYAGWQLAAGGVVLLLPAILVEGPPTGLDAGAVLGHLWLGLVGGLVAYGLWFDGLRRLPVTATALLGLLSPLTAALMGVVVLGQVFTWTQLGGYGLALAALVAGQLEPRRRGPSLTSPPAESGRGCLAGGRRSILWEAHRPPGPATLP
ncbi:MULTISPECIES: EamA family transporter [Actinomycetes]